MKFKTGLILTSTLLIFGCATPKQAELGSTDPQLVIKDIEHLKNNLIESNADVLAKDSYAKGNDKFIDALEDVNDNKDKEEIMTQLAQSKAYFLEAAAISKTRKVIPKSIMEARQKAISAKPFSSQSLTAKLDDIDDDLRDETKTFTKDLSSDKLSSIQSKYLSLEVEAIKNTRLGTFRRIIKEAKDNDAEDLAPKTFKDARSKVKIAENLINQSPRNPSQFVNSVGHGQ